LVHDPEILDRLSGFDTERFEGNAFRATRKSLDPLTPSTNGGRWAPRDAIAVLYMSLDREGALAEIAFHWGQFSPLPSKPVTVHRIGAGTDKTLRLLRADLLALGVDWERYGEMDYARTQEIGAAVAFLEYDGLIVPSARWGCDNLILFSDNHSPAQRLERLDTEEVDWIRWAREHHLLPDDPA
jgi:RES domain-containing protein